MSTTPSDANIEPRWRTYLRAAVFAAPAMLAWGFARVYLFPKFTEICSAARLHTTPLDGLWYTTWVLMRQSLPIWVALILIFVLLGLFGGGWARYRRLTVGIFAWVVNVIVLFGLTVMLILSLIAASSMASSR